MNQEKITSPSEASGAAPDFVKTLVDAHEDAAGDVAYLEHLGTNTDALARSRKTLSKARTDLIQALTVPAPEADDFLSVRDQFAMAALQGELASQTDESAWNNESSRVALAIRSFSIADVMMKARKQVTA